MPELPTFRELLAAPLRKQHMQLLAQAAQLHRALHCAGKSDALQQRRPWGLTSPAAEPAEQDHHLRWLATPLADAPRPPLPTTHWLSCVCLSSKVNTLMQLLATG